MGIAQVRKAIAAAVLAAAAVLVSASQSKGSLDQTDYISAVIAGLIAGVGVFYVPNAPLKSA
jgi:hypothetical protein